MTTPTLFKEYIWLNKSFCELLAGRNTICATCPCTTRRRNWSPEPPRRVSNKKPKTFPTLNITFVPQPISKGKSCPEVPGSKSSNPNGWHMKSANGTRMPSRGTKKNSLGTLGFILVSQSFQSF